MVAGAGTGYRPIEADAAAADIERRRQDPIGADRLEGVDGADNVDDRVERANFVEMNVVDRGPVDRRLRLAKPLEQVLGAILAAALNPELSNQRQYLSATGASGAA